MELDKARTLGDAWAVFEKAGLTKPHVSTGSIFKDAEALRKLLNRISKLEAQRDELLEVCRIGVRNIPLKDKTIEIKKKMIEAIDKANYDENNSLSLTAEK